MTTTPCRLALLGLVPGVDDAMVGISSSGGWLGAAVATEVWRSQDGGGTICRYAGARPFAVGWCGLRWCCCSSHSSRGRSTTCCPRLPAWRIADRRMACARTSPWRRIADGTPQVDRSAYRAGICTALVVVLGAVFAVLRRGLAVHVAQAAPAPGTDLASLLQQNPGEYAHELGSLS